MFLLPFALTIFGLSTPSDERERGSGAAAAGAGWSSFGFAVFFPAARLGAASAFGAVSLAASAFGVASLAASAFGAASLAASAFGAASLVAPAFGASLAAGCFSPASPGVFLSSGFAGFVSSAI